MSRGQYTVIYERDKSGAWLARVREVPGCHTYGRSIHQAERRIREALSLWVDDADQAELFPKIRLPRRARDAVRKAEAAAQCLNAMGLSVRDTGEVLGISHQRAQQILSG